MTGSSGAGQAKSITLGEVVRAALPHFAQTHRLPAHHWKVLRAIAACHTPALGGHQYRCLHCGREHFVPHSCGNRHCPSCQKLNGAQWLSPTRAVLTSDSGWEGMLEVVLCACLCRARDEEVVDGLGEILAALLASYV